MSHSGAGTPCVSIVLPTYNGEAFLHESLQSCLNQTLRDLEVIVVVDGSTDGTEHILAACADERLRVVRQGNEGLPAALNAGFALAKGRLWSWTSDDNVFLPEAMEVMARYLEQNPQTAMVCTDFLVMDETGRTTSYDRRNWACFLYRAEAAALAGPYRPEFTLVEDVDFFLRLRHYAGRIDRLHRPYYKYRQNRRGLSGTQTAKRQFVSLKLHCDLVARGIEQLDLLELFQDRLSMSALYRDTKSMDSIAEFAAESGMPFADRIRAQRDFLRTWPGWWWNRLAIARRSQWAKLRGRTLGIASRLRWGKLGTEAESSAQN